MSEMSMTETMDFTGKKILVIGAARQGLALSRFLVSRGAFVVLNDLRTPTDLQNEQSELNHDRITWVLGSHPVDLLDGVDLVCPSGGIPLSLPLIVEATRRGIPLSNDSQIFLEQVPCKVIGITGSAGKTTTTTLVGRMAKDYQTQHDSQISKVFIGGNIGQPLIDHLDELEQADLVVMELSSFQLEIMTSAPDIAAVLNITPNHLDRHGNLQSYTAAKERIITNQKAGSVAILNRDDPGSWSLREKVPGKLVSFGFDEPPAGVDGTFLSGEDIYLVIAGRSKHVLSMQVNLLRGKHNVSNILAACSLAATAGISNESIVAGLRGFTGVDHRLQFVRERNGVLWYNDSIATAPERAIAAILSFDEPLVLLAGGRDKELPWGAFSNLVVSRVDHLVLFGEAALKIEKNVAEVVRKDGDRLKSIKITPGLFQAVVTAENLARPGDVVLLSPGGTSYDEFKDFEERGEWYKKWVNNL